MHDSAENNPLPTDPPLGDVIAERRFTLLEKDDRRREITVQIGKPVPARLEGEHFSTEFRCPILILGLHVHARVFAPVGGDALEALQYAISLAGQIIDNAASRLDLRNPYAEVRERHHPGLPHFEYPAAMDWIWRYDFQPLPESSLQALTSDETSLNGEKRPANDSL